jgi:50S ribosomal subunit-associated GTPase HflX
MNQLAGECVFISAAKRTNIDELRKRLMDQVKEVHFRRYPNLLYKPEADKQ